MKQFYRLKDLRLKENDVKVMGFQQEVLTLACHRSEKVLSHGLQFDLSQPIAMGLEQIIPW